MSTDSAAPTATRCVRKGPKEDGVPNGIRTRVLALKGPRPGPLDDGDRREKPSECSMGSHAPAVGAAASELQGAWQVTDARAGLYIFAGTHYSMMAATTDRPDITDLSKATREDLLALY